MEKIPNNENLESGIQNLLKYLEEAREWFEELPEEIRDEWQAVETEAKTGLDRQAAKDRLENFVAKVEMEIETIRDAEV